MAASTLPDPDPARNPNVALVVVSLDDLYVQVRAAVRAELAALAPRPPVTSGLLSARELAKALGTSPTGVQRLDAAGMPRVDVGSRRRYDLDACRAWLAAREPAPLPTTPKKRDPEVDTIDVTGPIRRAGLRAVGGGR